MRKEFIGKFLTLYGLSSRRQVAADDGSVKQKGHDIVWLFEDNESRLQADGLLNAVVFPEVSKQIRIPNMIRERFSSCKDRAVTYIFGGVAFTLALVEDIKSLTSRLGTSSLFVLDEVFRRNDAYDVINLVKEVINPMRNAVVVVAYSGYLYVHKESGKCFVEGNGDASSLLNRTYADVSDVVWVMGENGVLKKFDSTLAEVDNDGKIRYYTEPLHWTQVLANILGATSNCSTELIHELAEFTNSGGNSGAGNGTDGEGDD